MLSICIPVYNYNIVQLVNDLHNQAERLHIDYEIQIFDDGSQSLFKEENREVVNLSNVKYRELEYNVGRSAIRNLLANEAQYSYLIFMDCDAEVCSSDYLKKYLDSCEPEIVCYGGRVHPDVCPDDEHRLRWLYGRTREDIPAKEREASPNESFITFNFLIDKSIFKLISFDERLKTYGHEDTLFGIELFNHGIIVKHIDNPLCHVGLETSRSFIDQTESSICNLVMIQNQFYMKDKFTNAVKLLRVHNKLMKIGLNKIGSLFFSTFRERLLRNLLGKKPSLLCFDLYKLGYLCSVTAK